MTYPVRPRSIAEIVKIPLEDHLSSFEESEMSSVVDFVIITPLRKQRGQTYTFDKTTLYYKKRGVDGVRVPGLSN